MLNMQKWKTLIQKLTQDNNKILGYITTYPCKGYLQQMDWTVQFEIKKKQEKEHYKT